MPPKGEPIFVQLDVESSLLFDIDASLYEDKLYLPAKSLFSALKIKSSHEPENALLKIFYPDAGAPVQLNLETNKVSGMGHSFSWTDDQVLFDENEVFLQLELIEQIWDFNLFFDYRKLKVLLFSESKLPVIQYYERKKRYQEFNKNISSHSLTPEISLPDTRHLLSGWTADWSLSTSHAPTNFDFSYGIGLGGQLLGGDFIFRGSGSKKHGVHWEQVRGRWKYPIYSSSLIKQIQVGDLGISNELLGRRVSFQGIKITNRPNESRKYFDTFSISNQLANGWDTEFYVNHQFQDYAIGDKVRRFDFTTPIKYGSNSIQLKYYNENGFHHQKNYMIYVPPDFLPSGKLEYTVSGGRYSYLSNQHFGQFDLNMGVTPNWTVGSGMMLEASEKAYHVVPFLQSRFRIGKHLIAKGGHLYDQISSGSLRMLLPSSQSIQVDVKKYHQSSVFNKRQNSLEASLNTSFPISLANLKFSTYLSSRYTLSRSGTRYLNLYSGISSRLPFGISMFLKGNVMFRNIRDQELSPNYMQTKYTLSKYLLNKLLLRPTLTYNHSLGKITDSGLNLRYRISPNSYLNASLNRDHLLKANRFLVSFSLNLPFARSTSHMRGSSDAVTFNQTTSGSVSFNPKRNTFNTSRRSQTGKAALSIYAFLDLNRNKVRDSDEPLVEEISADIYRKGASRPSQKKKKIFKNLIPYEHYMVKVNEEVMSNPLWKPIFSTLTKRVLPNTHNTIAIPVVAAGEVSGSIVMEGEKNSAQLNNLEINLNSLDKKASQKVETYLGGNFYYVGLLPGTYEATFNPQQLADLSLEAVTDSVRFRIKPTKNGDIVDDLNLRVASLIDENSTEIVTELYTIQVGAFQYKENAVSYADLIEKRTEYSVKIEYDPELNFYVCRVGMFKSEEEVSRALQNLTAKSFIYPDAFIVKIPLD